MQTICNSLLLGLCVVLCSTIIAVPTAYLLACTQLAKHSWLDIIFMIPFMTPPYIASMGWILFMQKKGLFQQLFPATGSWSEGFFCFGGQNDITNKKATVSSAARAAARHRRSCRLRGSSARGCGWRLWS